MMQEAIARLVDEAVKQGHPREIADDKVLASVATIITTAAKNKAVVSNVLVA